MHFLKSSYEYLNNAPLDFESHKDMQVEITSLDEDIKNIRLNIRNENDNVMIISSAKSLP